MVAFPLHFKAHRYILRFMANHKLVIEMNYEFDTPYPKKFFPSDEVPRGAEISFTFTAKNVSNVAFPSGVLKSVEINTSHGGASMRSFVSLNLKLPFIKPNEKIQLHQWKTTSAVEGIAWVKIDLTANDKQPIECYQYEGGAQIGTNIWAYPLIVIDRELLDIRFLLEKLLGQIDALSEKLQSTTISKSRRKKRRRK